MTESVSGDPGSADCLRDRTRTSGCACYRDLLRSRAPSSASAASATRSASFASRAEPERFPCGRLRAGGGDSWRLSRRAVSAAPGSQRNERIFQARANRFQTRNDNPVGFESRTDCRANLEVGYDQVQRVAEDRGVMDALDSTHAFQRIADSIAFEQQQ